MKELKDSTHWFQSNIVKKLEKLEMQYCKLLSQFNHEVFLNLERVDSLKNIYSQISQYLTRLQVFPKEQDVKFVGIIKRYSNHFDSLHQNNLRWIYAYCELRWPSDDYLSRKFKKKLKQIYPDVVLRANKFWLSVETLKKEDDINHYKFSRVLSIKKMRDSYDYGSPIWHKWHKQLVVMVFRLMSANLKNNRHQMDGLFKESIYQEVLSSDVLNGKENVSSQRISGLFNTGSLTNNLIKSRVNHWFKGYKKFSGEDEKLIHAHVHGFIKDELQKGERNYWRNKIFHLATFSFIVAVLALSLYQIRVPQAMAMHTTQFINTIKSFRIFTKKENKMQQFFLNEMITMESDYTQEDILSNLKIFSEEGWYLKEGGYYYFAQEILKGMLVLWADGQSNDELNEEVIKAANLLNAELGSNLSNILALYQKMLMRESKLRENMLELRRLFIKQGVYPFMFLVLNDYSPFIFMYPEKIINEYIFEDDYAQVLGMNVEYYSKLEHWPPKAYVLKPDSYPFENKAGYFEGEFAVVFESFAANVRWTAWHELGHVIENFKYEHESKRLFDNVELNAMIFPVIFDKDARAYLTHYVVPLADRKMAKSYYGQAAKGILNGLVIYEKLHNGRELTPLLTNRMEEDRKEVIKNYILSLTSKEIRKIGYTMYFHPDRYLYTTEAGKYRGIVTNAEEIIFGAHSSPEQDVVMASSGLGGFRLGSKMIRDGDGSSTNWAMQQLAAFIDAIIVFILFESSFVFMHILGTPIRIKKFKGRRVVLILNNMFKKNQSSDGHGLGEEVGLRQLLTKIYESHGNFDQSLIADIQAFKLTANSRDLLLFQLGLTFASENPKISEIKNPFHLIQFYLPFLGPYIARSKWLYGKQKAFDEREVFNKRLEHFLVSLEKDKSIEEVSNQYNELIKPYAQPGKEMGDSHQILKNIKLLEKTMSEFFLPNKDSSRKINGVRSNKNGESLLKRNAGDIDFDRLEVYTPGDDVREIDWNVTARSAKNDVIVRKRVGHESFEMSLLLDMSVLSDETLLESWVQDYLMTLKLLGKEKRMQKIMIVMPYGKVIQRAIKVNTHLGFRQTALKTFSRLKEYIYDELEGEYLESINGLKFYDEEENNQYLKRIKLCRFKGRGASLQANALRGHHQNIFLVGVIPHKRLDYVKSLGRTNSIYFWHEQNAQLNKIP